MTASLTARSHDRVEALPSSNLHLKKHKLLPRPGSENAHISGLPRLRISDNSAEAQRPGSSGSINVSPRTLKRKTQRIGSGPDLPPTPPEHSRTVSNPEATRPSSAPSSPDPEPPTPTITVQRAPKTPPDQRSPPTPDETPPQPQSRPRALRPSLLDRGGSRSTTVSRTESFKTAREEPFSSDDEEGKLVFGSGLNSRKTSQGTVRRASDITRNDRTPKPQAITTALSHLSGSYNDSSSPRTLGGVVQSDVDRGPRVQHNAEASPSSQPPTTGKIVVPRISKTTSSDYSLGPTKPMSPSEITRAARKVPLRDSQHVRAPSKVPSERTAMSSGPSNSGTSVNTGDRNSSSRSSRSTASTVVEALLVEAPPQRQRTLRHVRKHNLLRHTPASSPETPLARPLNGDSEVVRSLDPPISSVRPQSYDSDVFKHLGTSSKARREVRRNGGIPVAIVPNRRSSSQARSNRTPSLRSTSSRRSKGATSLRPSSPEELQQPVSGPVFDRPPRHSRSHSLSDGSVRTMDYRPSVPKRSSSLSAPTSRTTSRAGSLTTESLRAHNALLNNDQQLGEQSTVQGDLGIEDSKQKADTPQRKMAQEIDTQLRSLVPPEIERASHRDAHEGDHLDDTRSSRKTHPRNTPFSVASFATTGTAPEVAEAMAVHMYAHQNSSVLMVEHSGRPSEETAENAEKASDSVAAGQPKILTFAPDGEGPATPPQLEFTLEDVDSPLRNPRPPPQPPSQPPTFNLIPATPSGLTPATVRAAHAGNYFEVADSHNGRRPSLVRRALSKRRHSYSYPPSTSKSPGFLTRTLSLSRKADRPPVANATDMERGPTYPQQEDKPVEVNRLHPFWRPIWAESDECDSDCECRQEDHGHDGEYYRYPFVDNRPVKPKRTFSQKMKRTFAILPLENDFYFEEDAASPERRTIRRTPSGNLRVMRKTGDRDSSQRLQSDPTRPRTAPEAQARRTFWRGHSMRRRSSKEQLRRRYSLGSRLEGLQGLTRRMSEKRREKRSLELRAKISGPMAVRDGVEEVIRSGSHQIAGASGMHGRA